MAIHFPDQYVPEIPAGTVKADFRNLVRLVTGLLRPYRRNLMLISGVMLLETLMSLLSPWPLKIIIDNVIGGDKLPLWLQWIPYGGDENKITLAAVAAMAMILITAIGGLAEYLDNYLTESVAQHMANDLRRRMYHHLQNLSHAWYDTQQSAKIVSTITTDVATIQEFASSTLLSFVVDMLTILGMLVLMFYMNWDFALIAVGFSPFLLFFVIRFRKAVKKATHQVRKDQSEMFSVLQHGLESIRVVKAFGRQELEEEHLKKVSLDLVDASLKARKMKSLISPVITLTISLCTAFVLLRGADLIMRDMMTIGALTVFLYYLNKFFSPVKDLAKMVGNIAQASVALERVQHILDTDMVIPEKPGAIMPAHLKGDILFENVSFGYKKDVPVLQHVNLAIKAGEHIGICGPTGGGKSTFANLIPRFYDSWSGKILIDGTDIREYALGPLRSQIGFVLQDTTLFYGTILENISYGRPDAPVEEIKSAARRAHAGDFIMRLPLGYQTLIGERGITLSAGERQRIGIARAILRNSPILILDEPTASLDTESEKIVIQALEELMENKTVITITHRLNIIRNADRIFVIDQGRITENGNHDQLMAENGLYARLWQIQLQENEQKD